MRNALVEMGPDFMVRVIGADSGEMFKSGMNDFIGSLPEMAARIKESSGKIMDEAAAQISAVLPDTGPTIAQRRSEIEQKRRMSETAASKEDVVIKTPGGYYNRFGYQPDKTHQIQATAGDHKVGQKVPGRNQEFRDGVVIQINRLEVRADRAAELVEEINRKALPLLAPAGT